LTPQGGVAAEARQVARVAEELVQTYQ